MNTNIIENIARLATISKQPILSFINIAKGDLNRAIRTDHYMHVYELLKHITTDKIGFVLNTRGGYSADAFMIATLLRTHVEDIHGYVPFEAYSGGTLIIAACNEITMSKYAKLGPLDAQLYTPGKDFLSDRALSSGLDALLDYYLRAIEKIQPFVSSSTQDKLTPMDDLKVSAEIASRLIDAIIEKPSHAEIGISSRANKSIQDYLSRILSSNPIYFDDDRQDLNQDRISSIVNRLTTSYSEHSFVITPEEAEEIGLPVFTAEPKEQEILDNITQAIKDLSEDLLFTVDPQSKLVYIIENGFLGGYNLKDL